MPPRRCTASSPLAEGLEPFRAPLKGRTCPPLQILLSVSLSIFPIYYLVIIFLSISIYSIPVKELSHGTPLAFRSPLRDSSDLPLSVLDRTPRFCLTNTMGLSKRRRFIVQDDDLKAKRARQEKVIEVYCHGTGGLSAKSCRTTLAPFALLQASPRSGSSLFLP
jgi:hypothetical protein